MAYANAHVKVTIFGTSCAGQEEWSTGFRMGSEDTGGGNFGVNSTWLNGILPFWQTFFTSSQTGVSTEFKTVGIKAGVVMPDGKYDLATITTATYATPISGENGGKPLPPQCSLVAQLRAASPVGLGAKGRMYLPGICHQPFNGHISAIEGQNIANGVRTFLDACEGLANSPGYVMNASQGRPGVPFTAPVNRRVTMVRVGSVYDTQRRRRNGLSETYYAANLAA